MIMIDETTYRVSVFGNGLQESYLATDLAERDTTIVFKAIGTYENTVLPDQCFDFLDTPQTIKFKNMPVKITTVPSDLVRKKGKER